MTTFDSTKSALSKLLEHVSEGKILSLVQTCCLNQNVSFSCVKH